MSGYAFKHATYGCSDSAVFNDKQIEARSFRDIAIGVEKHYVFCVAVIGLKQCLNEVQPMVVLDPGIDRFGRNASDTADS